MSTTKTQPAVWTVLVRDLIAFTGYRSDLLRCEVDFENTIRVWDSVASEMTSCHSISDVDQARIRQAKIDKKQVI